MAKTERGENGVKSAMRTLDLLEVFSREARALSLSELARLLDVPISSCHLLVRTLEARGYLYIVGRHKEIYPSRRILGLAQTLTAHDPWLPEVIPFLQALRDRTRETVILGKRERHRAVYLAIEESKEPIRFSASVGDHKPLHVSAIGRALLAELDDDALPEMLARLATRYPNALSDFDPPLFARELAKSKQRGWFLQRGGRDADVMAMSVVFSAADDRFAISIAGPLTRVTQAQSNLLTELLQTRNAIEEILQRRSVPELA